MAPHELTGLCPSCCLYRAIYRDGNLVDSLLSEHRDMDARVPACGCRFFAQAIDVVGHGSERVTTDGHASYPRAIRETMGEQVEHRCSQYLNNRLERDHRGIKQRYYPMRGFGSVASASRFCSASDGLRDHFRARGAMGEGCRWRRSGGDTSSGWRSWLPPGRIGRRTQSGTACGSAEIRSSRGPSPDTTYGAAWPLRTYPGLGSETATGRLASRPVAVSWRWCQSRG